MAKKRKKNKMPYYIASAMAVLAAASVGLMFYSGGLHPQKSSTNVPVSETQQLVSEDASGFVQKRTAMDYPLMKTDLPDVYVSADPYGMFTFYDYANGAFTPCTDVKEKEITVSCSHQDIPTKLYYMQRDGSVTGYGLFLTTLYEDDVRLYEYALFRLVDMPSGYGSGDAMLLVDFDHSEFPYTDKAYSEVFSFDIGSGKATRLTSNNGRTVDNFGRLRTDWAQMNNALLELGAGKYYLSGRNYQLDSSTADILYNADTSNEKPKWIASGLWENWMHTENGVMYYAKETESGFDLYSMNASGTETNIGSYADGVDSYLFSGDYMLEKNTFALKRISTDENKDTLLSAYNELAVLTPTAFSVSPDGNKLIILCDGETQSAILYNLSDKTYKLVQEKGLFTTGCDQLEWLSDGQCMTIAETETGYETLLWKF